MTLKAVLTCSIEMVQKLCQFNGTVFSQVRKAKWQTNKLKHCFPHLSYCVLLAPYSCWETSWVKKHIRHNILYMNSITHIYVISFIFQHNWKVHHVVMARFLKSMTISFETVLPFPMFLCLLIIMTPEQNAQNGQYVLQCFVLHIK